MKINKKNNITIDVVFALIAIAIIATSCAKSENYLTTKEREEGWQLLFDGKSLNGWRDYNGSALTGSWDAADGCIHADGKGSDESGYIVTKDIYENFEIKWDWKISKAGNSGLLYHVVEGLKFPVPYITGPEYQLIDNLYFQDSLEKWQMCGADYAMYTPDSLNCNIFPAGQWNNSKIIFDNGHVVYYLNGNKIIEYEAWTDDWHARKKNGKWMHANEYGLAKKGVFCLQNHGYPAWFRNIKVRELQKKTKEISIFNGEDLNGWEIYGQELWYVQDSILISKSGPNKGYGYLATRDYYDDFEFTADFKQVADGNSGVFFRSFIEPGAFVNGWQVEVAPKGRDTGGIYESYGRGWLIQIPEGRENILKAEDWNTMRIRVQGENVTTWLNGEEMASISDEKIAKGQGRIALQIHDGGGIKVLWKNLNIKTL